MRRLVVSRVALAFLVFGTPVLTGGMPFPGEQPCLRDVDQPTLPEMHGIRLGMSTEQLLKARPSTRRSDRADDMVEPSFVLHGARFPKSVRMSAYLEDGTVFGREALLSYRLYGRTLGAITASLRPGQKDQDTFTIWADVERQLIRIFGEPTLRSPYCLTKSCGAEVDRGRLSPEDVASSVGYPGLVGLHSVWGLCPVRVRLVASVTGVHISFENRHLEEVLRDEYYREQVTNAPQASEPQR